MPIKFDKNNKVFHLYNKEISYLIHISKDLGIAHLYFGSYLKHYDVPSLFVDTNYWCSFLIDEKEHFKDTSCLNFESSKMEYPGFGMGDYRGSAIKIKNSFGDCTTHFIYKSHKIIKGKYNLEGLPSLYDENDEFTSLFINAIDESSVSNNHPIITRSSKIINQSNDRVIIKEAYSSCLDFKTSEYDVLYLSGRYGKERNITRNAIHSGMQVISSTHGKSSHACSPFVAIVDKCADEDHGNVYGMN